MNCIRKPCQVLFNYKSKIYNYSSYCSSLSLKNLYPDCKTNIVTPKFKDETFGHFSGFIPIDQLHITYSRSSGPGGQNVNVVNTKVDLRFHVASAKWLSDELKKKLLSELKTKITKEGFLVVRSDKTRSQQLNLADALERLRSYLFKMSEPEPAIAPETEERLRRRKERAIRLKMAEKRSRSLMKQDRQAPELNT